ncbi:EAL domain-containing protein [Prosthecomicrobium pneumaticum]|uniref:Diguanylate cyclase (GGDEF)-like protein n=1 Tax=Prosthecomicrobium pneumaticum TaxID=81895 RepID=A0A7W9FQH5_9HYPH|nr:diguanylate cyclase (GGDEF)-like protein [Prosthecomicrobium pneumaticum]
MGARLQDPEFVAGLAAAGAAAFFWSTDDDRMVWSAGADALFGVSPGRIATGAGFASLVDAADPIDRGTACRRALVLGDRRSGIYAIGYRLAAAAHRPALRVGETGHCFADPDGRLLNVLGIVRPLAEQDGMDGGSDLPRDRLVAAIDRALAARDGGGTAAFLLVSIDDFALFNELYGFETGDRLIARAAERIRGVLAPGDAIGRYSGGKLGLVLADGTAEGMRAAAEHIADTIAGTLIETGSAAIATTVSIGGVALPDHARSAEAAMGHAKEALREARQRGRGRFVAYRPSPDRETIRRENAAVSHDLAAALREGRLALAHQPIVDARSGEATFHEALLRLARSDGSLIAAGQFLPLAERLGLARVFDEAALDLALGALVRSPAATLSVNVSPETYAAPQWLAALERAIADRGDLAGRLIVEITESTVIRNLEETDRFVAVLHGLGARVAIDDFGAGFTSFRVLRRLDVDFVKIDGSYCRNIADSAEDRAFVRALAALARDLDIRTIAEWVEDAESAAILREFGVDYLQGRLLGAPMLAPP